MFSHKRTDRTLLIIARLLYLITSVSIHRYAKDGVYHRALRKAGAEIALLQKETGK